MIYVYILAGLVLLLLIWSYFEQKIIVKTEYTVKSGKKGVVSGSFKFAVISDLHNIRFGKNNEKLIKAIFDLNPDFIIIAGDLITKRKPCYPGNAYDLLKVLADRYPIYYAYGNHEQQFEDMEHNPEAGSNFKNNPKTSPYDCELIKSWQFFKSKIAELGVQILDNKSVTIKYKDNTINITGLSIDSDYYRRGKPPVLEQEKIHEKIGKKSPEAYQILIAHNPIYFKYYASWGADLILSGHVHGGIIRLPFVGGVISPQVRLFPKYDAGLFEETDSKMIVSRGLGSHSFMPRLFNPPELVVINLKAD